MIWFMLKSLSRKRSKDQACQLTENAISLTPPQLESAAIELIIKVLEQVKTKMIDNIRQNPPNRAISPRQVRLPSKL